MVTVQIILSGICLRFIKLSSSSYTNKLIEPEKKSFEYLSITHRFVQLLGMSRHFYQTSGILYFHHVFDHTKMSSILHSITLKKSKLVTQIVLYSQLIELDLFPEINTEDERNTVHIFIFRNLYRKKFVINYVNDFKTSNDNIFEGT